MISAMVGKSAGRAECMAVGIAIIQVTTRKVAIICGYRMNHIIIVGPGDRGACLNCEDCRTKLHACHGYIVAGRCRGGIVVIGIIAIRITGTASLAA